MIAFFSAVGGLIVGGSIGYIVGNLFPLHAPKIIMPKDMRYPSGIGVRPAPETPPQP